VTFALNQNNADPNQWERLLGLTAAAAADGVAVRPQVTARTVSILLGFQTFHPFAFTPVWGQSGLGLLPWRSRWPGSVATCRCASGSSPKPERWRRIRWVMGFMAPERSYLLGNPPDYEPSGAASVTGIVAARGAGVWETFLDLLLADGGRELLNSPVLNYSDGNLDATREMLVRPTSVFGLGDGGAHAGQTCDASTTTFLLSYWARDRREGRIAVEEAVRMATSSTADLYGLGDRGRLLAGMRGDVNVIDLPALQLHRPELAHDLPGGARRLIQRADGYIATVNAGQVTVEEGEDTGAALARSSEEPGEHRTPPAVPVHVDVRVDGGGGPVLGRALRPGLGRDQGRASGRLRLLGRPHRADHRCPGTRRHRGPAPARAGHAVGL